MEKTGGIARSIGPATHTKSVRDSDADAARHGCEAAE